jgi:dihydropteroate synthase
MGIVNATPDSFSDGGLYLETDAAVDHALKMIEEGADIIDVGGESSRPGARPVSVSEEIKRVVPVIEKTTKYSRVPISVDTTKSEVAEAAIEAGATALNDISAGCMDPRMAKVAAKFDIPFILMHMRGEPQTMQKGSIVYADVVKDIAEHLESATQQSLKAGVRKEMIIWDPGLGFGKTVEHNLIILNRLPELIGYGFPVLVGPSRKSFIGKVLSAKTHDRLLGTAAAVAVAVLAGVHIVRVHDVMEMKQVIEFSYSVRQERY